MTCDKAGTIEDVLKRSTQFNTYAKKNQIKELVIIRDGKAISSHFPCSLIKDEELTLKYIKTSQNLGKPKPAKNSDMMFHVAVRGGKNVVRIMRNPEIKTVTQDVTVYACKGEKVKHALKRDGRFLDVIFKKTCLLSHTSTEATTEMSDLVDKLEDEKFQIIELSKSSPPDSQPSSLDDAYLMPDEGQMSDSDGRQDPSQVTSTTESGNNSTPKEKRKQYGNIAPEKFHEIPDSKKVHKKLSSSFKVSLNRMKSRKVSKMSQIKNVFREEYGKNAQTCREVRTMKKLMELSHSVCHVRINQGDTGSGFLLFDKFVLTNGHVIKNVLDLDTLRLREKVTVHFSYENLGEMDPGTEVEEVAGFEYCSDESGHRYDWALLRLGTDPDPLGTKLRNGLLTHFGFLPQRGGICIIGHPDSGVKMIDPCAIVPKENCNQVAESHRQKNPQGVLVDPRDYDINMPVQLVTPRFFDDCEELEKQKNTLNYETCFYSGSSGSPVFDEHCNVVAVHSGGYVYTNRKGERESMIEFGYRLSDIIEHIIFQLVRGKKFDVLKKYLSCSYRLHEDLMKSLKKLVESRDTLMFQDAMKCPEVASDESLKKFFEFLCHKEAPVPMDLD